MDAEVRLPDLTPEENGAHAVRHEPRQVTPREALELADELLASLEPELRALDEMELLSRAKHVRLLIESALSPR